MTDAVVHVAVGILINEKSHVCISRRLQGKHLEGLWEFPGGKVDSGETVIQALERELQEELGVQVVFAQPFTQVEFQYTAKKVLLDVFTIREFSGIAHGVEGQEVKWVAFEDLSSYQFPDANVTILERLLKNHGLSSGPRQ